jgi:hypothetical protein
MLGFTRDQCRKERPSSRNFLDAGLPGLRIVGEPRDPTRRDLMGPPETSRVCTENLNSGVVVVESAKDGARIDDTGPLNRARDRRILVQ